MKIAVNKCFGGFDLSDEVFEALIKKGWRITHYDSQGNYEDDNAQIVEHLDSVFGKYGFVGVDRTYYRTHPDLIEAVEQLGKNASGRFGDIRVVEIPDDIEWEIDEYDGIETVHEKHRSW